MITTPHDKYFKQLFSNKAAMSDFLINGLPQVAKLLKIDTLQLDPNSYIDKSLNVGFSDLAYKCQYAENIDIKICLLFEHKSYIVNNPYLQLLGYMLKIWEQNVKQKQRLMPIIPILFYHGKDEWDYQTFENYFGEIDSNLKQYLPTFKYEQVNTINWSDEQIQKMFTLVSLKIGVLMMKHIFDDPNYLLNELSKILNGLSQLLETDSGKAFLETTIIYLISATQIKGEQVKEKVSEISQNAVEIVETGLMVLQREEREKEKKRVIFKMLKQKYSNEIIQQIYDISDSEIEKMREIISEIEQENI